MQKGISDFTPKVGILPLPVVNEIPFQESLEDPRLQPDQLRQLRVNVDIMKDSNVTFGRKQLIEESKSVWRSICSPADKVSLAQSNIMHRLLEGVKSGVSN